MPTGKNPRVIAKGALATLMRLKGAEGQTVLQEVKGLFHKVKMLDHDASLAIGRVGQLLEANDPQTEAAWNDAIAKTRKWLNRT